MFFGGKGTPPLAREVFPFPPSPPSLPQRALSGRMDGAIAPQLSPWRSSPGTTTPYGFVFFFGGVSAFFAAVPASDFFDGFVRFTFEKGGIARRRLPTNERKNSLPVRHFSVSIPPGRGTPVIFPLRQTSGRGAPSVSCR